MRFRRPPVQPLALGLVAAVATGALVTAGWAARDGGRSSAATPVAEQPAPVQAGGHVQDAPPDGDRPDGAIPLSDPQATAGSGGATAAAADSTTTTGRKVAPAAAPVRKTAPPSVTTAPAGVAAPRSFPDGFAGSVAQIDGPTAARMTSSWRPGCPVGLPDLRLVRLTHWGLDGQARPGEIVVHRDQADRILAVFAALFDARFPIEQVRLVDEFGGDDSRSMAANNTSGFNCRPVAGSRRWSQHAYGRAIDINPVQNPYVVRGAVHPPEGRHYVRRDPSVPGLITAGGPVVAAFARAGWSWGGRWPSPDYQHFSSTGR